MKFLFSLFILCYTTCNVSAQANLVFNQVKNTSGTWITGQIINNIVVPTGKVLKIESATFGSSILNTNIASILVGNHIVYSGSAFSGQVNMFPLWLSEGSYAITISSSSISTHSYSISGIEFNVIP